MTADHERVTHRLEFLVCEVCGALTTAESMPHHEDWHWLTDSKPEHIDGSDS